MKKILILFGSTGTLGKFAVEYFLDEDFDFYYFVSRKSFSIQHHKSNYKIILTDDLSIENNVERVFSQIDKEISCKYFLFSTIGGFEGSSKIWETESETWERMIKINLTSSFFIAKHFAKLISNTGGGSICFTSAESSFNHEIGKIAYGISKNGINYLIKSLANEGKEILLTANGVAPFAIDTAENRGWIEDATKLTSTKKICDAVNDFFINHPKISGKISHL